MAGGSRPPDVFASVLKRGADDVGDMRICDCVVNVLAVAAPRDEPFRAQHAEALRHGREILGRGHRDLADALLAKRQTLEQREAAGIAYGSEERGGPPHGAWWAARDRGGSSMAMRLDTGAPLPTRFNSS
jgi:hypothetical protein